MKSLDSHFLLMDNTQLIKTLKAETAKYARLKQCLRELRAAPKRTKVHRCSSVNLNFNNNVTLHTEGYEKQKFHLPLSAYSNNVELCETIERVFERLIEQYSGTSWCKDEKEPVLHAVALKQFWLDCYTSDQNFLSLLTESISNKPWINVEGIYNSIEAAQRLSAFNIFPLKRYDKKLQKNFLIQKLLCNS